MKKHRCLKTCYVISNEGNVKKFFEQGRGKSNLNFGVSFFNLSLVFIEIYGILEKKKLLKIAKNGLFFIQRIFLLLCLQYILPDDLINIYIIIGFQMPCILLR